MNSRMMTLIPQMHFPQSIYYGNHADLFLQSISNTKKLFIVSKSWSKKDNQTYKKLCADETVIYHTGEPVLADVERINEKITKNNFDYLIAVGGGSVIDLVKIVKKERKIPMIAIPTTIGSGSEVSRFSVLIDEQTKSKKVINDLKLLPEIIIFNSTYLKTLSPDQIIYQSLDALAHSLEAAVSRLSNYFSDLLALGAIDQIYRQLSNFSSNNITPQYLEEAKIASTLAGLAQSSAATGLTHSFAHVLGPQLKLSHANTVAMFLIDVIELNLRHTQNYQKLGTHGQLSPDNLVNKLKQLYIDLKIKPKPIHLSENIEIVAKKIRTDVCTLSNPYYPTIEEIILILKKYQ